MDYRDYDVEKWLARPAKVRALDEMDDAAVFRELFMLQHQASLHGKVLEHPVLLV
ncbi:MAG: hypothetical protein ACTSU5_09210 [Promethearchaeota archaeon]